MTACMVRGNFVQMLCVCMDVDDWGEALLQHSIASHRHRTVVGLNEVCSTCI